MRCLPPGSVANRLEHALRSFTRAFGVIDFKFQPMGTLQGAEKVAQMGGFGNHIEGKSGKDQLPKVRVQGREDNLRHVEMLLIELFEEFQPRFEGAVDVDQ